MKPVENRKQLRWIWSKIFIRGSIHASASITKRGYVFFTLPLVQVERPYQAFNPNNINRQLKYSTMYKYRYLAVILVLILGTTFTSCDSTSSNGNNLESLITNSTWYATVMGGSNEAYLEYDFGESTVTTSVYQFPCGEGESYQTDEVDFEVEDDETITIDGDDGTVVDYSEDEISIEAENQDGETTTVTLYPSCEDLEQ